MLQLSYNISSILKFTVEFNLFLQPFSVHQGWFSDSAVPYAHKLVALQQPAIVAVLKVVSVQMAK